ncbi:MAG: hypothetical protein ACLQVD_22620 [Capsulimonadaceae bacterium]
MELAPRILVRVAIGVVQSAVVSGIAFYLIMGAWFDMPRDAPNPTGVVFTWVVVAASLVLLGTIWFTVIRNIRWLLRKAPDIAGDAIAEDPEIWPPPPKR